MTEQQKAEAYVRSQIPELMELSFGCEVKVGDSVGVIASFRGYKNTLSYHAVKFEHVIDEVFDDKMTTIGHPIQLQHWLRVLAKHKKYVHVFVNDSYPLANIAIYRNADTPPTRMFDIDLTTGQPDGEADYKAFNEIVCN